jgi:hypothetical protein
MADWVQIFIHTKSTEQYHSREGDCLLASQKVPGILRNPKVYYCVKYSPPLVSILDLINPYISQPVPLRFNFNIIFYQCR